MLKSLAIATAATLCIAAGSADAATIARRTMVAAANATGVLFPGGDAAGSSHIPGGGVYVITFPKSAHEFCGTQATLFPGQPPLFISAVVGVGTAQEFVTVGITDANNNPVDAAFYVTLVC